MAAPKAVAEEVSSGTKRGLPIAEEFTSVQGEGLYTGTLMRFVRLAGCSVGRPFSKEVRELHPELPIYTEMCEIWDGRTFACDTDFRRSSWKTVDEILSASADVGRLCITGGEPLNHDLTELVGEAVGMGYELHLETSGTVWWPGLLSVRIWVTVSPKRGVLSEMLRRADELKLLVDERFNLRKADELVAIAQERSSLVVRSPLVWVQPVNKEFEIDYDNVRRCVEIVRVRPTWRVSLQLHKILNVR